MAMPSCLTAWPVYRLRPEQTHSDWTQGLLPEHVQYSFCTIQYIGLKLMYILLWTWLIICLFGIFRRKTEIFLSLSGDSQEMPIESLGLYFFNWQVEVWTFSGELAADNNLRWTGQEQRSQTPNLNLELITIKYSNQIVFCRLDFKFVTFILALTPIMEYAKLDLRLMDITEALAANNTTVNSSWWTGW